MYNLRSMAQSNRSSTPGRLTALLLLLAVALPAIAEESTTVSMSERVAPCLSCHAETGLDLEGGFVPSLHGKPAGYLYNQLVNYQQGRRHNSTMAHMVRNLSPAYLREMAEYFAGLDAAHSETAPRPSNRELGQHASTLVHRGAPHRDVPACIACHGRRLTGAEPDTPGLLGLPGHYLAAQLSAWREGVRHAAEPDCMGTIAQRLSSRDIQALSQWLSAQPLPEDPSPLSEPPPDAPMPCGSVPSPE